MPCTIGSLAHHHPHSCCWPGLIGIRAFLRLRYVWTTVFSFSPHNISSVTCWLNSKDHIVPRGMLCSSTCKCFSLVEPVNQIKYITHFALWFVLLDVLLDVSDAFSVCQAIASSSDWVGLVAVMSSLSIICIVYCNCSAARRAFTMLECCMLPSLYVCLLWLWYKFFYGHLICVDPSGI